MKSIINIINALEIHYFLKSITNIMISIIKKRMLLQVKRRLHKLHWSITPDGCFKPVV